MSSLPFSKNPSDLPADPAERGRLRLTMRNRRVAGSGPPPRVTLDGHPVGSRWGTTTVPVAPGRWYVEVECYFRRPFGHAGLGVDVAAGEEVEVFYAPPWHQFRGGSIGLEKQRSRGLAVLLLLIVVTLALGIAFALYPR